MKKLKVFGLFIIILIGYVIFIQINGKNKNRQDVIKIGAILPLSGDFATYGSKAKKGFDLAANEINQNEIPIINIIYEDSKGNPKDAINAYNKLKATNINTIIGLLSSPIVLSLAPLAEKDKILLFSTGASSPEISKSGKYIFRDVPSDIYEPRLMAKYAFEKLKKKYIGILYINNDYGIGVLNEFTQVFTSLGGNIKISESYNKGTTNFSTQLSKIILAKPDALYLVGYRELGLVVKQFKELGGKCQLLSTALFEDQEILTTAGSAANGVIFTSITFDNNSKDPVAIKFKKSYFAKYRENPDGFAAVAYDGLNLIYNAMKSNPNDTELTINHLLNIKNYKGLLGTLSFDENGDVVLPIKLKVVKNNKFQNLD